MEENYVWVCNECGSHEYTSTVRESDIYEWLSCSRCGGCEFHKEKVEIEV